MGTALPQVSLHILDPDGNELSAGEVGEICVGPSSAGPFAGVALPAYIQNFFFDVAANIRGRPIFMAGSFGDVLYFLCNLYISAPGTPASLLEK